MRNPRHAVRTAVAGVALGLAVLAMAPGRLTAQAATAFVVDTAADLTTANPSCASPCSLRQAITDANAATGAVTITFSVAGPFDLSNGELTVSGMESLTVNGAAGGSTVIHQDGSTRVLRVNTPTTSIALSNLTLTGGHAQTGPGDDGFGGAIDLNTAATATLTDTTISGNLAAAGGGGINANTGSALTLVGSTISGNTSTDEGGGVDDNTTATLTAIDTTFTANTAGPGGGGALAAITAAQVTLVNDTIAANTTPTTTGFGNVQTTGTAVATVTNTIISGNTGANCAGTLTDGGNNLENGSSCAFATAAQHADPLLGPLQDNGGPTSTMALDPGSPAIGAGSNSACAAATNAATPGAGGIDQRGAVRPQASTCDIGAYEVVATTTALQAPATATSGTALTLSATVTPRQAIPGATSGTVSFFDGSTLLGSAPFSGGSPATLTTTLTPGNHSLTASFTQTPLFLASTSPAATIAVAVPTPTAGAGVPWGPAGGLVVGGLWVVALAARRRR